MVNTIYTPMPDEPSQWNGFGDLSTTFEYLEDCYFRVGAQYGKNRTDAISPITPTEYSQVTLDQDTFAAYGVVSHQLTPQLTGRATGQAQWSAFNGGLYDGENVGVYIAGLSLLYDLNDYLGLEAGYNFDRVDSDLPNQSYSRNRVFLGVRGQF